MSKTTLSLTLALVLNFLAGCNQTPAVVPMTGALETEDCDTGDTGSDCDEAEIEAEGSTDTGDTGEEPEEDTGNTDTGEEEPEEDTDFDNDGYTADVDCDESDPAVNPGAIEICDGQDNNCDGNTDEELDCDGLYEDVDGDGMTGLVDCDDNDPDINPLAEEVEDGVDNDCDGEVDEGFESEDTGSDDLDSDGDGYTASIDCDDTDPSIYPGADEDSDTDGIDQDCDGTEEETETSEEYSVYITGTYPSSASLVLKAGRYYAGDSMEAMGWEIYETATGTSVSDGLLAADYSVSGACGIRINMEAGSDHYCYSGSLNSSFTFTVSYDGSDYDQDDFGVWIANASDNSCSAYLQVDTSSDCDPVDAE